MNIIFMGTPEFAAAALSSIIDSGYAVTAVFTQPDKPVGRKQTLTPPPVKTLALEKGISVYQPKCLRDSEAEKLIKELRPDIIVVAAYGNILPENILNIPPKGCVNIHASLLPKYRGSSPIQAAILNGDSQTGITTMLMDSGIDTGDILETAAIPITEDDDISTLFDKLAALGGELIVSTLKGLESGTFTPQKQGDGFTYAPIIKKEMAQLDFSKSAALLHNMVRAYAGWPVAFFIADDKKFKVHKTSVLPMSGRPGEILRQDKELIIACKEDAIKIEVLQPENGKKMPASDYLLGHTITKLTTSKEEN